jgi:hypothetical protein
MLWSQFSAIFDNFRRKNAVFLKNECYDQIFSKFSFVLCQKRQFLQIYWRKYFKNHNIGPKFSQNWAKMPHCQKAQRIYGLPVAPGSPCSAIISGKSRQDKKDSRAFLRSAGKKQFFSTQHGCQIFLGPNIPKWGKNTKWLGTNYMYQTTIHYAKWP